MMVASRTGVLLAVAMSTQSAAYEVNVTRQDANLYEATGSKVLITTRYCYEYVYYEDAILRTSGRGGQLIFLSTRESCDVAGLFGSTSIEPGRYQVSVTRESDNWYSIIGVDAFIRTTLCLSLAMGDEAILDMATGQTGTLYLSDRDKCSVTGIYSRVTAD